MRYFVKKIVLLVALSVATIAVGYAQGSSEVELKIKELVKKYDSVKGVDCMTVVKGGGLEMVKLMFNKQFGKDFMRGVKSITIIGYSEASIDVCQALHKEMDIFQTCLKEFNLEQNKELSSHGYIRTFALPIDDRTISDFLIAMEDEGVKMIVYMAGEIRVEEQDKEAKSN